MLSKIKAFAQKLGFFSATDSAIAAIKEVTSPGELEILVGGTYLEKVLEKYSSQNVEALKARLLAIFHPANQSAFFSLPEGVALQLKFKALNAALNDFVAIQRKQEAILSKLSKSTTTNLQVDKAQDGIDDALSKKVKALEEALQKAETAYIQTLEKLEGAHKEQLIAKDDQIAALKNQTETLTKSYQENLDALAKQSAKELQLAKDAFQLQMTAFSKRIDHKQPLDHGKKEVKPIPKKKEE